MSQYALTENTAPLTQTDTPSDMGAADPLGTTSISSRVAAILALTQQLTGLLAKEIGMLKTRRPSALRETETEKRRLSMLYAQEMRAIQMRPELLAGATPEQKARLREVADAFKACLAEHIRALTRSRVVREAMIVAVGEELNRRRQPPANYQRSGNGPAKDVIANKPAVSAIAVDRSI
ncbi:MAG: hypothetical protein ACOY17_13515 [Pseudomonadota bacterium]|jgi:hypothetical protein